MAQTKKTAQHVDKKRVEKANNPTHLEQTVNAGLTEVFGHLDAEQKRLSTFVEVKKVVEFSYAKDKHLILIYIAYKGHKVLLNPIYKKITLELEKKLKKTVLLLSTRVIESRWIKKNRTQKRANSRTLSAVYTSILDELILPGIIIASRTRVRLDGSSFTKVTLDKADEPFLEDRIEAIQSAYKRLTNRDIVIDFQKDSTFYVLKKGEKK